MSKTLFSKQFHNVFIPFFFNFSSSQRQKQNRKISAKVVYQSGTCTWSKIRIKLENSLGLVVIRITGLYQYQKFCIQMMVINSFQDLSLILSKLYDTISYCGDEGVANLEFFFFLRVIAVHKPKIKLKRLSTCYDIFKFIQSFQDKKEYHELRELLRIDRLSFHIWKVKYC